MEEIARRRGLTRVVLTGSESTGKSGLARDLAALYGCETVPEFVRDFTSRKGAPVEYADSDEIARGQIALEDRYIDAAHGLLIQDTDLLSTVVYCDHYYGQCAEWIRAAAAERRPDLYLLLEIDVPWVPDDVRDRGDRRDEMQQLFRDAVAASGSDYVVISGPWEMRLSLARAAIDDLIGGSRRD